MVLLDLLQQHFDLEWETLREVIQEAHRSTVALLSSKGASYLELKTALVPQRRKREITLLFDTLLLGASYGVEVMARVIPLLGRDQRCSILTGDLTADDQRCALDVLNRSVQFCGSSGVIHPSQLYGVYVNNLSNSAVEALTSGLASFRAYVGWVDTSYRSPFKDWMSVVMAARYVKAGRIWVCGHEEDRDESDNVNTLGWPINPERDRCISVSTLLFQLLLSYKVERRVLPGLSGDNLHALNAISGRPPERLRELSVHVDEGKLAYLAEHKAGSLERACIMGITSKQLASLITAQLTLNYYYNLRFDSGSGASLFNVMIEVPCEGKDRPCRLIAAIRYEGPVQPMHLVTLY